MSAQSFRTVVGSLEQGIHELLRRHGGLADDELVVHYDLVANTCRMVDGEQHFDRLRWSTAGSNPHTSYGSLHAEAVKIRTQDLI